ncbi:hypothetical protein [Mycoplasma sp. SG1]|uniref:hypothetical protein n=1 Tax=Mycoplasma sp. SG1 TaxID=2810348 RepID=UPI002023FEF9|nr:hypothetical protein [Mycoplasma sp. SG1]URM52937.1 hypothetical protein JRW51_01150 [Mycoplasma sp. SG1]
MTVLIKNGGLSFKGDDKTWGSKTFTLPKYIKSDSGSKLGENDFVDNFKNEIKTEYKLPDNWSVNKILFYNFEYNKTAPTSSSYSDTPNIDPPTSYNNSLNYVSFILQDNSNSYWYVKFKVTNDLQKPSGKIPTYSFLTYPDIQTAWSIKKLNINPPSA